MPATPAAFTLELTPAHRLDVIDVNQRIRQQYGDLLSPFRHAIYCSYHTTAGYFEQRLVERLGHDAHALQDFLHSFQTLFPEGADYRHDQLDLRRELSDEQRACEPKNADSHLTFIGSGLTNCATYQNQPDTPVYFVDLDGVNGTEARSRRTTVLGFNQATRVDQVELRVPVSSHPIDSVNLRAARLGLFEQLQEHLDRLDIQRGRIDLRLAPSESHAGLTMNEYETLLMQHDLVEVLRNPLRFMAEKGRNMLRDPRAIPSKAKNYAKYDLVQVVNESLDKLGLSESLIERVVDKFFSLPASRFLRLKRTMSLPVLADDDGGRVVQGRYQSPILVQWQRSKPQTRTLQATFVRFE